MAGLLFPFALHLQCCSYQLVINIVINIVHLVRCNFMAYTVFWGVEFCNAAGGEKVFTSVLLVVS